MLALDALESWEPGRARARMRVPSHEADSAGRVSALMALEYMAQTVAACLGMEATREGAGVRVGMVVACRELQLEIDAFEVGATLVLEAERVQGNDSVSHFDTRTLSADGVELARARLTLVHGERLPDGSTALRSRA